MGSQASVRLDILSRLYDRMGWTLSHGHNNLHRTKAIREIGGFGLSATCEDTIVSLQLGRKGWRIILVATITYDTEPRNVFAFRRRAVRWARQTADAIAAFRSEVTWPHGYLMARHLFSYLLPSMCLGLLALVAVMTDVSPGHAWDILNSNFLLKPGHLLPGLISYLLCTAFLLILSLRIRLFLLAGGNLCTFCLSVFLSGAVFGFCSFHVTFGLLRSFLLGRTGFLPTGMTPARDCHLRGIWRAMAIPWLIYIGLAGVLVSKPGLLIFGFNLMWSASLVTAPFVLWLFHQDQRESR
jgi:cellulose synthase/poly-beta-1,6-N-acetylglucosamine synthase-like glycosyltransferase